MFIPSHYRNNDIQSIVNFVRNNPFAIVSTSGAGLPEATHIPIEVVETESGLILQGHVSRANPHWKDFEMNHRALAIFSGPHTYVSSAWYNHANVPTWNYMAVHDSGPIEIVSEKELYQSLQKLMNHYEGNRENPVIIENLPAEMIDKYLKGIVGFNIHVEKLEGKWKLSQNRDKEDFENSIKELEKVNDINAKLVADEMKKISKQ
jgi:transcriptional regulator